MYGVTSSGNQAGNALRSSNEKQKDIYPEAAKLIIEDKYVDNCGTGAKTPEEADKVTMDFVELLACGGFSTKGFTMSKKPPLPSLTKDGSSINVLGIKWY